MLGKEEKDTLDAYGQDLEKILKDAFMHGGTCFIIKIGSFNWPYARCGPVTYARLMAKYKDDIDLLAILNDQG